MRNNEIRGISKTHKSRRTAAGMVLVAACLAAFVCYGQFNNRDSNRSRSRDRSSNNRRTDYARSSLTSSPSAPAATTDFTGSGNTNSVDPYSYPAFKLVVERNIFNTRRSARYVPSNNPRTRATRSESFALVGVMGYEKGPVAFFEGTRSDYQKVLKKNDTIAGFTVAAIEPAAVKLTTATNSMELHVGMQLRREDEGDWKMSEKPESLEAPPRSTTLTSTYQNYSRSNDQPAPPQQGFPDFSNPEATVAIISNVLNSVGGFQPPPGFNPDGGGDFNQRTNTITAPSSPGNVNDALERLRRRREQENNQ